VQLGSYYGAPVAVKVVNVSEAQSEARLGASLHHPNVVRTLTWRQLAGGETLIVMEHCDEGTLADAIEAGRLRDADGQPNLLALLATARDVASGMAFVHGAGVVHGDLTAANVMLSGHGSGTGGGGRGFVAKVSDFGLSAALPHGASEVTVQAHGAAYAMAPEVLSRRAASKAADVWSFGVLLWQLCVGTQPWGGAGPATVIASVCVDRAGLGFEPDCGVPECLQLLASACMAWEPSERPTFEDILDILEPLAAAP
jgi:serine/threonine protein kinase